MLVLGGCSGNQELHLGDWKPNYHSITCDEQPLVLELGSIEYSITAEVWRKNDRMIPPGGSPLGGLVHIVNLEYNPDLWSWGNGVVGAVDQWKVEHEVHLIHSDGEVWETGLWSLYAPDGHWYYTIGDFIGEAPYWAPETTARVILTLTCTSKSTGDEDITETYSITFKNVLITQQP